jgi:hypothetical protein
VERFNWNQFQSALVVSVSNHFSFTLQKKSKISGYAVASGLQYGRGENIFHYFFKVALYFEKLYGYKLSFITIVSNHYVPHPNVLLFL